MLNKKIPGYDYLIHEDGRVFSLKSGMFMSFSKDKDGYKVVGLTKNGKKKMFKQHRLIAQAFIPNPNNKPEVNHINSNKADNRLENLEWCTRKYNAKHAYDNGNQPSAFKKGEKHKMSKLSRKDVIKIKKIRKEKGLSHQKIADIFGVCRETVSVLLRGKTWKHITGDELEEGKRIVDAPVERNDAKKGAKYKETIH